MATVYQRGKIWWGRFQYRGQEFRASLETPSRSIALRRLSKWERETKAGAWGEGKGHTYDEAMESFLDNHCPTLRPKSKKRYEVSAAKLTAFFSEMALSEIKSAKLAEYEGRRRAEGASAPTIRRDLACLSSMFTHAIVDLEWTDHNPVLPFLKRQKIRGRLRESAPRTRYLSHDEETRLLKTCRKKRLRDAICFAIDTGLRSEEQWGLTWDRVTLTKTKDGWTGEILIPKALAKGKRDRRVPLLPRSAQILAQLPRTTKDGKAHVYVWVNGLGERFVHRSKGLRMACTDAGINTKDGINNVIWHDLRRTCGCRLLQDYGLSLDKVRDWLGHKSVQQTERAYAFLKADALHDAVQKPAQDGGL